MTKIGFIGVGMIGCPMATRIVQGGFDVIVYDIDRERVDRVVEAGARAGSSIAEVAGEGDVVITVLPDAPDVEEAALGPGGIVENIRSGAIYIDMSTIDPGTSRKVGAAMAGKGVRMIDSPVTRSVDHAWRGELALLIGGDPAVVDEVRPILDCMANMMTHCGDLGTGSAMKLVNNYLAAGIVVTVAESLGIGLKSGLSLETIMEATGKSGTANRILLEVLPGRAFKGNFEAGFMCTLARKDQRLAIGVAEDLGIDVPVGRAVYALLEEAVRKYPGDDFTSLLRLREEQADFEARLPA